MIVTKVTTFSLINTKKNIYYGEIYVNRTCLQNGIKSNSREGCINGVFTRLCTPFGYIYWRNGDLWVKYYT